MAIFLQCELVPGSEESVSSVKSKGWEKTMTEPEATLRRDAEAIWRTAVAAARPEELVRRTFADPSLPLAWEVARARRIVVVGAGKAGAAMSAAVEVELADKLGKVEGLVNVPAGLVRPLRAIRLHPARPDASNQPTAEGVAGTRIILELAQGARADDVGLCLLSGGGSALLPAPVEGITLEEKQQVTQLLLACGATINEMNAVRKHLSAIKGGRLATAFRGRALFSLIISDVIGDPLDVIASGPTAADPTTFADSLRILQNYDLEPRVPAAVLRHLGEGAAGRVPETLKEVPPSVTNLVLGNNARSLSAAQARAEALGYRVLNLGSFIEGETRHVATALAGIARSMLTDGRPFEPPACILSGGETTVTLPAEHGQGGRNQEFVLAAMIELGRSGLQRTIVLSGGTDGEDGPTDAAGALADRGTLVRAAEQGLDPAASLRRCDAYHFFEATGDLFKTGLTQTNVMDVRVMLLAP
jgi:hydroxypyruvate reductase/glycerate 2-kinase